jgi:hypothetical protein
MIHWMAESSVPIAGSGVLARSRRTACLTRLHFAVLAFGLAAAVPTLALAEPSPGDRAIAERLFEQGRAQLANGQAAACESFSESMRLDPGTGILLHLATCHETIGRLASAWVEFRESINASRREGRGDRVRYAEEHLLNIEPNLAYLTIQVAEAVAGDAPVITLDGRVLGPPAWGVAVPVDAGWHEVVAQNNRGGTWRATVKSRSRERRLLSIPVSFAGSAVSLVAPADPKEGEASAAAARPGTGLDTVPDTGRGTGRDLGSPSGGRRGRRIAGGALGVAGVVSLGVGGYFGLRARSLWAERNRSCPMEACTPEGLDLGRRADSSATLATVTIAVGAVAVGAAAVLLLWPDRSRPSSGLSSKVVALALEGFRLANDGHGRTTVGLGGAF